MYAIYEKKGGQLSLFEDEGEEFLDLNEAEEILRQLRRDKPEEYERIANLRDGIRTVKPSDARGVFAFCQAGRYQQLFLVEEDGKVASRDIPRILSSIKCGRGEKRLPLPDGYNKAVMRVLRQFKEEVKHRESEREHTFTLSHGQRYALRELRLFFGTVTNEDIKARVNLLENAFRGTLTKAVERELNKIRRNGITGENLIKALGDIYTQYGMRDWLDRRSFQFEDKVIPKIICSEGLG